jgi:hypothetical protein
MSDNYFAKFPLILYNGQAVINITERTAFLNTVYNNPYLYYQYNIKPGERPDNIADRYYENQYMDWILYLSNKVIDPYYDWYLDQNSFNNYIVLKYGSIQKAFSKIKFYRNNWYENIDQISPSAFALLNGDQQSFYNPIYSDDTQTLLIGYVRNSNNLKITTNGIATYNANGSGFINDEVVNVTFSNGSTGRGQILFTNTSIVNIQHLSGTTVLGLSGYLNGNESFINASFTSATLIANNIPSSSQQIYWSPVSYYDYENEINERNKSIQVLNSRYSSQISSQLDTLLQS